jgi:hypothetical protein
VLGGKRSFAGIDEVLEQRVGRGNLTLDIAQSGVVDDPVQPRLHVAHLDAAVQRVPGAQQRLLHDILAALCPDQALRMNQEGPAMSLDEHRERSAMTFRGERSETFVSLRFEKQLGGGETRAHAEGTGSGG